MRRILSWACITEGADLELRVDYFNSFNWVNLQGEDPNFAGGTRYRASTSALNPRSAQIDATPIS